MEWVVENGAVERVHSGVMGRIRRRRYIRRGAVAAVLLALAFVRVPMETETLSLVPPKAPVAPAWVAPRPVPAPKVVLAKAAPRPAERITILTDDPDVVIVLVSEGGEE